MSNVDTFADSSSYYTHIMTRPTKRVAVPPARVHVHERPDDLQAVDTYLARLDRPRFGEM